MTVLIIRTSPFSCYYCSCDIIILLCRYIASDAQSFTSWNDLATDAWKIRLPVFCDKCIFTIFVNYKWLSAQYYGLKNVGICKIPQCSIYRRTHFRQLDSSTNKIFMPSNKKCKALAINTLENDTTNVLFSFSCKYILLSWNAVMKYFLSITYLCKRLSLKVKFCNSIFHFAIFIYLNVSVLWCSRNISTHCHRIQMYFYKIP